MTDRSPVASHHPTLEDFEGFLRAPPQPNHAGQNALIVRHLLAGCSICRETLQALGAATPALSRALQIPASSGEQDLHQAIPLIDRREDPLLFLTAHHNLAICYVDLGRPEEALALFCDARDLYRSHSDSLILLRATWQEGKLLREIGHFHNAEAALLRARQGFMEAGLAYEAAMVSLDLAEVYRKAGLTDKLRRTIAEALPIFKALRVSREIFASLLRLQDVDEPDEPASG